MKNDSSLPEIRIASRCSARWKDMQGDEQCRLCAHCEKRVYNFAEYTEAQIIELIVHHEGKVCARLYKRIDGTVITSDCMVGLEKAEQDIKILICSAVAGMSLCLGILFGCKNSSSPEITRSVFEETKSFGK
jgi:hypothetical protein